MLVAFMPVVRSCWPCWAISATALRSTWLSSCARAEFWAGLVDCPLRAWLDTIRAFMAEVAFLTAWSRPGGNVPFCRCFISSWPCALSAAGRPAIASMLLDGPAPELVPEAGSRRFERPTSPERDSVGRASERRAGHARIRDDTGKTTHGLSTAGKRAGQAAKPFT